MAIYGNPVGGALNAKTFMLEVNGGKTEIAATVVGEQTVFDATENDVRKGMTFASSNGVKVGTKHIPAYETCEGYRLIKANEDFKIELVAFDLYNYTKLQCIICPYNTSIASSVSAEKVVLDDNVYPTNSTTVLANVTKDTVNKTINLGIPNDSSTQYVIRFFTYREDV